MLRVPAAAKAGRQGLILQRVENQTYVQAP
jgi:hypothetical protein